MKGPPPGIDHLIRAIPRSLGSYAPVVEEIERALESPRCSLPTMAEAIEKDPDLTATLLRLGNSAFYGFSMRLTTVTEALSLIGIQQVQDLIQAACIIDTFTGIPEGFVNMRSFWQHSLACGVCARALALEARVPRAEKFFVAGLLHDVGRLVLYSQSPKWAQQILARHGQQGTLLREAEVAVLGYDHAAVAEALLQHWNYPPNIVQAVGHHHNPAASLSARDEASVVHVADHLVNAIALGSSGEHRVPPLQRGAWERLKLAPELIPQFVASVDEQMEVVEACFLKSPEAALAA